MINQINSLIDSEFLDEDGEKIQITLLSPLTTDEIAQFKSTIPKENIPHELINLLRHSRGIIIKYSLFNEIRFDDIGEFGFHQLIQLCLTLTGDGAGNFWIQEITSEGIFGEVFFVCHDPPVLIKQADNLKEFLDQIKEHLHNPEESFITEISDKKLIQIYKSEERLIKFTDAIKSQDNIMSEFAKNFDTQWVFGDLRKAKIGSGVRIEANYENTVRNGDELIWAFKKNKSLWSKVRNIFR